jgi:uncharacterized membrane protein YdbT with pleckstrin-like domain
VSYVSRTLMPGEAVLYQARCHKLVFVGPVLLALLAILTLVCFPRHWQVALVPGGLGLLLLPVPLARFLLSEYSVTTERLVVRLGVVERRVVELLLPRIEAVTVEQTVLDRLFDAGTVVVTGTGGTRERFAGVAAPLELRRRIQAQMVALEQARAERGAGAARRLSDR